MKVPNRALGRQPGMGVDSSRCSVSAAKAGPHARIQPSKLNEPCKLALRLLRTGPEVKRAPDTLRNAAPTMHWPGSIAKANKCIGPVDPQNNLKPT